MVEVVVFDVVWFDMGDGDVYKVEGVVGVIGCGVVFLFISVKFNIGDFGKFYN